jgi:hypothetical protein
MKIMKIYEAAVCLTYVKIHSASVDLPHCNKHPGSKALLLEKRENVGLCA